MFNVVASGTGGVTYQWRLNGTSIAGATAASYTTPATAVADDGALYSVVVANAGGGSSVTSADARLTVLATASAWTGIRQDTTPYPKPPVTTTLNAGSANVTAGAIDAAGNVFLAGTTSGWYDAAIPNISFGSHVVKYSAAGVLQWAQLIHPRNSGNANAVAADAAGNVFVLGEINGVFPGQATVGSGADIYLAKYNPEGAFLWLRQFGQPGTQIARGLAVDHGGHAVITGATGGEPITIDGQTSAGSNFVAKFNGSGALVWITPANYEPLISGVVGAAVDASDNVYIAGSYVAKFSSGGAPVWNVSLQSVFGTDDPASKITVSADGSVIYIGGKRLGSLDPTGPGGSYGYVARLGGVGDLQWVYRAPVAPSASTSIYPGQVNGLATDALGNGVYAATSSGVVRFEASGTVGWFKTLNAVGYAALLDPAGQLFVAGTVTNRPSFGTPGVYSGSFESWFVQKMKPADGSLY